MAVLSWNKGTDRAAMQNGEKTKQALGNKGGTWWDKAKTIGSKILKNPYVHGLANQGYDYLKKNHPKLAPYASTAQNAHNHFVSGGSFDPRKEGNFFEKGGADKVLPKKRPGETLFRQARKGYDAYND